MLADVTSEPTAILPVVQPSHHVSTTRNDQGWSALLFNLLYVTLYPAVTTLSKSLDNTAVNESVAPLQQQSLRGTNVSFSIDFSSPSLAGGGAQLFVAIVSGRDRAL